MRATSAGEGQGATFTVRLPLTAVRRDDEPGHQALRIAPDFRPPDLSGITGLVVDDQSDARDLLKRVLQDCDAAVVTAGSAEEALRVVEENEPDVLVSDIGMPDMDGYELLRRVRALGSPRGSACPPSRLPPWRAPRIGPERCGPGSWPTSPSRSSPRSSWQRSRAWSAGQATRSLIDRRPP